MFIGVAAAVVFIGGGVAYFLKKRGLYEGGERESKQLFKASIKSKNILKK